MTSAASAAVLVALTSVAAGSACANDFDALFVPRADGGTATPPSSTENPDRRSGDEGGTSSGDPPNPTIPDPCQSGSSTCQGPISSCAQNNCTNSCAGCCRECQFTCQQSANRCTTTCTNGADCNVVCENDGDCKVVANKARTVVVRCGGGEVTGGVCDLDCTDSVSCEVHCGDALLCNVKCKGGPCVVHGEDADVDCVGPGNRRRECPGNIVTCNRDCPAP